MTNPVFYSSPVALEKTKHKNLKLERSDTLSFARNVNSLPLAGIEYFQASRNFPVVFIKNQAGKFVSICLLSLKKDDHDLGDNWEDAYIPAYVRRYPFGMTPEGTIVIDSDAPHLQDEKGEALFEDSGEPSDTLKQIVGFLKNVDENYRMTEDFCAAMAERELFIPFERSVKFADATVKLDDLFIVDEEKFYQLEEKDVLDFFKKGWVAWVHAHLHSLSSVNELIKRHADAHAKNSNASSSGAEQAGEQKEQTENA